MTRNIVLLRSSQQTVRVQQTILTRRLPFSLFHLRFCRLYDGGGTALTSLRLFKLTTTCALVIKVRADADCKSYADTYRDAESEANSYTINKGRLVAATIYLLKPA